MWSQLLAAAYQVLTCPVDQAAPFHPNKQQHLVLYKTQDDQQLICIHISRFPTRFSPVSQSAVIDNGGGRRQTAAAQEQDQDGPPGAVEALQAYFQERPR